MNAPSKVIPSIEVEEKQLESPSTQEPPDGKKYYAPYSCPENCPKDIAVAHALHSHARNSVWLQTDSSKEWSTSKSNVKVKIVLGTGQVASPFTMSDKHFADFCADTGFSARFLRKVRGKRPFFEYNVVYSEGRAVVLEMAMSTYEIDSVLFLLRYDIVSKVLRGVVAFKAMDHLSITPLRMDYISNWLEIHQDDIVDEPLVFVPTLFRLIQLRSHTSVRWRTALYDAESRLGVTRDEHFLEDYPEISYDYDLLNAELASLGKHLADTRMSASTVKSHIANFDKIIRKCWKDNEIPVLLEQEIDGVINQADSYLLQVDTNQTNLQGLNTVLYNRINEHETQTTKSLAVIGLIFFPSNLVCAIFASGIFNLNNNNNDSPSSSSSNSNQLSAFRVSKYWHIFLFSCLGLTLLVLSLWIFWNRYCRRWLDRLKKSNLDGQWPQRRQIGEEIELRKAQINASGSSECVDIPREDIYGSVMSISLGTGSACLDGYCNKHSVKSGG